MTAAFKAKFPEGSSMIVVEGMDNSGKSTLVRHISSILPTWQIQGSEGPPKYSGESDRRIRKYLAYPRNVIYDRHPCVSQPIYSILRSHSDPVSANLLEEFYRRQPLFIYCDPDGRGLEDHVIKKDETKEHLESMRVSYITLLEEYRHWALKHAIVVYRIGDPVTRILRMIETLYR